MHERPPGACRGSGDDKDSTGPSYSFPALQCQVQGDKRWPSGGGLNGGEHQIDALRFWNMIGGEIGEKVVCARREKKDKTKTTALHKNNAK